LLTAGAAAKWNSTGIAAAVAMAQAADNVIVLVSNAEIEGGEGHDRSSLALPDDQIALATAVFAAIKGKPGVRSTLMMINGGVMAYDAFKEVPPSILEIFMPGVYGAQAVSETVWGTNVPSGKLPFTMHGARPQTLCCMGVLLLNLTPAWCLKPSLHAIQSRAIGVPFAYRFRRPTLPLPAPLQVLQQLHRRAGH
jgi:hypothetical protein